MLEFKTVDISTEHDLRIVMTNKTNNVVINYTTTNYADDKVGIYVNDVKIKAIGLGCQEFSWKLDVGNYLCEHDLNDDRTIDEVLCLWFADFIKVLFDSIAPEFVAFANVIG